MTKKYLILVVAIFGFAFFPIAPSYADDDSSFWDDTADDDSGDKSKLEVILQRFLTAEEAAVNEVVLNAALTGVIDITPLFDVWDEDVVFVGDFTELQGTETWDDVLATVANNIITLGAIGDFPFEVFHTITSVDGVEGKIYTRLDLYILKLGTPTVPGVVPDPADVIDKANCFFQVIKSDPAEDEEDEFDEVARYKLSFAQISSTPDSATALLWGSEQIVAPVVLP